MLAEYLTTARMPPKNGGNTARALRAHQDFERHACRPSFGGLPGGTPRHGVNEGETAPPTVG
eukprot:6068673-Lingulodinium_polyedra.AAC.1